MLCRILPCHAVCVGEAICTEVQWGKTVTMKSMLCRVLPCHAVCVGEAICSQIWITMIINSVHSLKYKCFDPRACCYQSDKIVNHMRPLGID